MKHSKPTENDLDSIYAPPPEEQSVALEEPLPNAVASKSRWERSWPVIAAGCGLFSDGYLNGVSDTYSLFGPLGY